MVNDLFSAGINIGKFNIINNIIQKNSSDSYLELKGGVSDSTGARLLLFGSESTDINRVKSFELIALHDGTDYYRLRGMPDGMLTWCEYDLGGSAVINKSLGSNGYINYKNGLILQWGSITFLNEIEKEVAFPITFKNGFRTFSSGQNTIIGAIASYGYGPLTNFKIQITNSEDTNRNVDWFAIGL